MMQCSSPVSTESSSDLPLPTPPTIIVSFPGSSSNEENLNDVTTVLEMLLYLNSSVCCHRYFNMVHKQHASHPKIHFYYKPKLSLIRYSYNMPQSVGRVAQIIGHGHGKIICSTLPLCVGGVAQIIRHGHGKIIYAMHQVNNRYGRIWPE